MFPQRPSSVWRIPLRLAMTAAICLQSLLPAAAQQPRKLTFNVSGPGQKLEMVVNSSRIVDLKDLRVPRVLVENPGVVKANPLSPSKVHFAALKPGITHVTLWDDQGGVHTIDVIVIPDARELEYLLKSQFPEASLKVRPLTNSVVVSGYCPSASMVSRVIAVAEDYYPKVINNIDIGGAQQVLLHVKVMEVSRTKLRTLGVDWALFTDSVDFASRPSGLILTEPITGAGGAIGAVAGNTLSFGLVRPGVSFFSYLEALRRNNLLKVLSEPTLTTVSGRAASFNVGGEFPILVPQSLGTVSIEYRQFGTRVDFVPIVRGNGQIRLEVRPQVSEIDTSRSVTVNNETIPSLRSRWVDTAAEMRAGQTLALAGLLQNRVEAETRSVPVLGDIPVLGAAFRRVQEANNEVELLILVTPELVEPMDKHEVPPCGPGEFTRSPSDHELYMKGWMEVPKCCENCGRAGCKGCGPQGAGPGQQPVPYVPQGEPISRQQAPANGMPGGNFGRYPQQQPAPIVNPSQAATPSPYGFEPVQVQPNVGRSAPTIDLQGALGRPGRVNPAAYQRTARAPGLIGPSGYDEIR